MIHMDKLYQHNQIKRLVCLISFTFLSACSYKPVEPEKPVVSQQIDQFLAKELNKPVHQAKPSDLVNNTLIPPMNINVQDKGSAKSGLNSRFDVSVDEVPIKQFYLGLVEDTPYNVVVHPTLQGSISLQLSNVTVPEVMDIMRDQYGYEYERTKYGYKVLQLGLRTKMFHVNYLNATRNGNSDIRVSAGRVTNVTTNNASSSGSNNGVTETNEGLGTQIRTITNADFWTELQRTLQIIIGTEEGRAVVVNPQVGVILVRAMPNEIVAVDDYLTSSELIAQRQVMLETKILEVTLKDNFNAGIDWQYINSYKKQKGNFRQGFRPGNDEIVNNLFSLEGDTIGNMLGGVFSATLDFSKFSVFIELLESQGNVQVLSSPQVSTLNNQKAVIRVGDDEFFITDVSLNTNDEEDSNNDQNNENTDVTFTPFFSGIALDVTPQISEDGYIILHVHPSVSEVRDDIKRVTIGSNQTVLEVPLALSTIRESDTIVRAENGQVVVIGGLIQNSMREEISATPLLGDVPIVGSMFRQTRQLAVKSELVILIKPTIIEHGNFRGALANSRSRLKDNDRGFHQGGKTEIFGNLGEFEPY